MSFKISSGFSPTFYELQDIIRFFADLRGASLQPNLGMSALGGFESGKLAEHDNIVGIEVLRVTGG
jgi:hypothetical protein